MICAGKVPSTWMCNDLADGLLKQMDVLFHPMHVLSQPCLYECGACRYGFTATIVTWSSVLVYLDCQWTVHINSVVIRSVVQRRVINSFLNNFLAWNVACHHSTQSSNFKHWFTTTFGGRCRKAMLGVCSVMCCGMIWNVNPTSRQKVKYSHWKQSSRLDAGPQDMYGTYIGVVSLFPLSVTLNTWPKFKVAVSSFLIVSVDTVLYVWYLCGQQQSDYLQSYILVQTLQPDRSWSKIGNYKTQILIFGELPNGGPVSYTHLTLPTSSYV